jgi:hypothetical protein
MNLVLGLGSLVCLTGVALCISAPFTGAERRAYEAAPIVSAPTTDPSVRERFEGEVTDLQKDWTRGSGGGRGTDHERWRLTLTRDAPPPTSFVFAFEYELPPGLGVGAKLGGEAYQGKLTAVWKREQAIWQDPPGDVTPKSRLEDGLSSLVIGSVFVAWGVHIERKRRRKARGA